MGRDSGGCNFDLKGMYGPVHLDGEPPLPETLEEAFTAARASR